MFKTLAHFGYAHDMQSMNVIDHCSPVIAGASIVIVILLGIIAYLIIDRQVKPVNPKKKTKK